MGWGFSAGGWWHKRGAVVVKLCASIVRKYADGGGVSERASVYVLYTSVDFNTVHLHVVFRQSAAVGAVGAVAVPTIGV